MKAILIMDSPLGALQLISESPQGWTSPNPPPEGGKKTWGGPAFSCEGDALVALRFLDAASSPAASAAATPVLQRARAQLQAYFRGDAIAFDLPLRPQGTPFQQAVWQALQTVPAGQTLSYALLAQRLGLSTGHARAVGAAVGRNPLLIVVPCHRIVGHDGALTGYAAGLPRKRALLDLERAAPIPTQTPAPRRPRVA